MAIKYSDEQLTKAVEESSSVAGVLRRLRVAKISGGMHSHISRRIKKLNLDTSHMTGQAHAKGKQRPRLTPSEILVVDRFNGRREHHHLLNRALQESGVKYECVLCGISSKWNNKKLILEIDHINRDCLDNRKENLRFLCPNCHSQV